MAKSSKGWMILLPLTLVMMSCLTMHPVSGALTYISIYGFRFNPSLTTVAIGANVTWVNNDVVVYTLWFRNVSDGSTYLLSPPISPGATWAHTFSSTASLNYYDFDRLWINGTLTVMPNLTVGGQIIPSNIWIFNNLTIMILTLVIGTVAVVTLGTLRRTKAQHRCGISSDRSNHAKH